MSQVLIGHRLSAHLEKASKARPSHGRGRCHRARFLRAHTGPLKGIRAFLKVLFFKAPHLCGHLFGCHPTDMPVEKQTIAAVFMPGPCDTSASAYVLTIRAGQMARTEHITSSNVPVGRIFKYSPPWPVLVVGKINNSGRALTVGQPGRHALHPPAVVTITSPAVDDIANGLFLVWIARTAKYLDVTVIVIDRLLYQKRHKKLEPRLYISSPFRRAWDVHTVMVRIKVRRKADLTQIISAHNISALFPRLPKYREQYSHQQRNNGNHHQQLYQSKPRPIRKVSSNGASYDQRASLREKSSPLLIGDSYF